MCSLIDDTIDNWVDTRSQEKLWIVVVTQTFIRSQNVISCLELNQR